MERGPGNLGLAPFQVLQGLIRAGDPGALAEFHHRYEPFLRRCARRWLSDSLRRHADSRDMADSVFRQVLPRVGSGRFEDEPRLKAWLAVVMRARVARLARRLRGPGGAAIEDMDGDPLAGREPSPAEAAEQAELVHRLRAAMEALAPDEREAVHLREFEGLEYAAVAKHMGRPSADAARKLCERARMKLRTLIDSPHPRRHPRSAVP